MQKWSPAEDDTVTAEVRSAIPRRKQARDFPWWLVAMGLLIAWLVYLVFTNEGYREAFDAIFPYPWELDRDWNRGITFTILLTLGAFVLATFLGLFIGLGRLATYNGTNLGLKILTTALRNLMTLYIELVRGIPMLVFLFFVALVLVPEASDLFGYEGRAITQAWRGTFALSLFYAAFIAEVFRAGIQSVPEGQREAGRAIGLTEGQIMRQIVLPQAIRNMLPALGNDLIALMKDTSLLSALAVRELTQMARLYTGVSFAFREGFLILMVIYVIMTVSLSLLLRWYENRITVPGY